MSSYDIRNSAQIAIDELIIKYKRRLRDLESTALRYNEDAEVLNRLNLLAADLAVLKITIDNASKKGDLNGKSKRFGKNKNKVESISGGERMNDQEKTIIQNELNLFEKMINEKKVDRISTNEYNITIEVVAFANLKNYIEKRRETILL